MKIILVGLMALILSSCGGDTASNEGSQPNAAQQDFLWDKQDWDNGDWE